VSTPAGRAKVYRKKAATNVAASTAPQPSVKVAPPKPLEKLATMYVRIRKPDDHTALLAFKQACGVSPGQQDVVMVLGDDNRSAIKMPFRVDATNDLVGNLVKLFGEDCVALR